MPSKYGSEISIISVNQQELQTNQEMHMETTVEEKKSMESDYLS